MPAGGDRYVRLPKLDWLEVDTPQVLDAEWFGATNELLLVGLKPGRALMLLGAEGKVALWSVRVGQPRTVDPALLKAAASPCKTLQPTPQLELKLTVTVDSDACRRALLKLFQDDTFEARNIEVTFTQAQLQAQLKVLQEAVVAAKLPVALRYVGAGLVVEGVVTAAQHRATLWLLVRHVVGRLVIDDQLQERLAGGGSEALGR